jgi:hypothetical protein
MVKAVEDETLRGMNRRRISTGAREARGRLHAVQRASARRAEMIEMRNA